MASLNLNLGNLGTIKRIFSNRINGINKYLMPQLGELGKIIDLTNQIVSMFMNNVPTLALAPVLVMDWRRSSGENLDIQPKILLFHAIPKTSANSLSDKSSKPTMSAAVLKILDTLKKPGINKDFKAIAYIFTLLKEKEDIDTIVNIFIVLREKKDFDTMKFIIDKVDDIEIRGFLLNSLNRYGLLSILSPLEAGYINRLFKDIGLDENDGKSILRMSDGPGKRALISKYDIKE